MNRGDESIPNQQPAGQTRESSPKKIRVMIADDHPIVREGLRRLLEREPDMEVVAEVGDGNAVVPAIESTQPDVVLLDLRMPGTDGLACLQQLQRVNHTSKIIVITASDDKNEFVQAMKLGCSGIVLKQTSSELIVKSIRKVNAGEIWLDSHTTAAVMRQFASSQEPGTGGRVRERSPLSQREREIVALVAQGYKNKEMAEKMFISEQTVKNHLHNIFDKLGVSDRLELALYAIHKGLHLEPTKSEKK
ncbi:MAG: response regulator transcription factor [Bryobacterales bacterium]|nr:response regulator transcription factor [Bryobacteraceae bacterium]MDW8352960.1 response regulator transcription factor [Bryobacterales bacterium]